MKKRMSLYLLLMTVIGQVYGQIGEGMDTVVVNATQIPLSAEESGRSITIITARQIQSMPVNSVDEVLQTVTGVEVQSRGGFGAQGDILMRGSTFTQVLILIDGMKMNDPLTGHFNSYIPVSLSEIQRIEILRGPAAAIYGADAVGGVINIVTRSFSDADQVDGTYLTGSLSFGQNELVSARQGVQFTSGKLSVGGSFSLLRSAGQFYPERIIDTNTTLSSYNSRFDLQTTGLSMAYRFNESWSLHARSSFDHRSFDARYYYTTSPFDQSSETVAAWWNQLRLVRKGDKGISDIHLAYKYNTDEFVFSPDFPSTNFHTTRYFNLMFNHQYELNAQWTLKGGIQLDRRDIVSNDRGEHKADHAGAYVMVLYHSGPWTLTGSNRADYDQNYGFEWSPQINAAFVRGPFVLRASAGKSIRAADFTERYVSNNLMNLTPGRSLGNPDLNAERAWSEELGFDLRFLGHWKLSATGFARQSSDLIDYVLTNQQVIGSVSEVGSLIDSANYYFARNIASVQTQGLESELNFRSKIGEQGSFSWILSYTFLNTVNSEGVTSVYLASHARHLLSSTLRLELGNWEFACTGLYKQRQEREAPEIAVVMDKNYMLWNGKVAYKVTDGLSARLQVQNIFDQQYQNILGAQMPGRWIMVGAQYQFRS